MEKPTMGGTPDNRDPAVVPFHQFHPPPTPQPPENPMVKTLLKLYSSAVATADNVASAIVPQTSKIISVCWAWQATLSGTGGGRAIYQLSLQSSSQWAVNDARGIIDEFSAASPIATTALPVGENKVCMVGGLEVRAGDKIYLHMQASTAFGLSPCNVCIQLA